MLLAQGGAYMEKKGAYGRLSFWAKRKKGAFRRPFRYGGACAAQPFHWPSAAKPFSLARAATVFCASA
jgi:hypothetical protein